VVAETPEDPQGSLEAGKRVDHRTLCCRVPGNVVSRQQEKVGPQFVRDADIFSNLVFTHERPDVKVGNLSDTNAVKRLGESLQADPFPNNFEIEPPVEKSVGAGHER